MKKKVLFAANIDSFFVKFLIPQLKAFHEMGYEVHIAAKLEGLDIPYVDIKHDICFARGLSIQENITSYKQMRKLFQEYNFDLISCHTPFGGTITRMAAKREKVKARVVYMAHGFHFYKGAPFINWAAYYNVEKYLAKYTDTIMTMNLDDYEIAKKKFKSNIVLVNGVGLDASKFDFKMSEKDKDKLREELGLQKNDFVMIYAAELLPRKRQIWLMKAIAPILKQNPKFHVLLPGRDSMNGKCQKYAKDLEIEEQVHFLGFRKDIPKLLTISNLALSSSKQEGLPVNIMEAMYVGLPIVATACRGNRDLIQNGENGYIVGINDQEDFCNKILEYSKISDKKRKQIQEKNTKLIQKFLLPTVIEEIMNVYKKEL